MDKWSLCQLIVVREIRKMFGGNDAKCWGNYLYRWGNDQICLENDTNCSGSKAI